MARRIIAVAVVFLVVLAGCQGAPGAGTSTTPADTSTATPTESPTTEPQTTEASSFDYADPEADVLGWEGGLWYNESIDVARSNGLNDTELDTVVNRSMARVERIRELEFEQRVPVEIISREEFANETADSYANVSRNRSLHQNVKFEATFMLAENESAIAQLQSNRAASVGGYYSPSEDRIVIVSENTSSPKMDEITLSQELFHALQEHRFDISSYNQSTQELHNAKDGIIEGDGNYVDYLYEQRCNAAWDCLMPQQQAGGGGGASDLHVGIYAIQYQPYSDGPPFVKQLREEGGWAAVNAAYENPPASTEQTIHPAKYGEDAPATVSVADSSTDEWSVPDMGNGSIDYAAFGEAGLYTTFWYQSYEATAATQTPTNVVVPYAHFFGPSQRGAELDAYNYSYSTTDGWDGDKLVPYVTANSQQSNETAYVWKTVWDSGSEASEFAEGYRALLDHFGAVEQSDGVYRIPEGESGFADAFRLTVSGNTVTIVNAPTVDQLDDVHAA